MSEWIGNKLKPEITVRTLEPGNIFVRTIHVSQTPGDLVLFVPKEQAENFKQLVNRAMNTWDSAPAELKEFADMVTVGSVQQDYKSQS